MADYIVCHKKRNNPRMDVRICENRCSLKEECEEFLAHHEIAPPQKEIAPKPDPSSIELEAA
jgi:hypothetical protein